MHIRTRKEPFETVILQWGSVLMGIVSPSLFISTAQLLRVIGVGVGHARAKAYNQQRVKVNLRTSKMNQLITHQLDLTMMQTCAWVCAVRAP
eukprot:1682231-Amphidinium_carterae.1